MSRLEAIRRHRLDCCAGSRREVRNCDAAPHGQSARHDCLLYHFRLGRNPKVLPGLAAGLTKTKIIRHSASTVWATPAISSATARASAARSGRSGWAPANAEFAALISKPQTHGFRPQEPPRSPVAG